MQEYSESPSIRSTDDAEGKFCLIVREGCSLADDRFSGRFHDRRAPSGGVEDRDMRLRCIDDVTGGHHLAFHDDLATVRDR
jgi:hypothetical protein